MHFKIALLLAALSTPAFAQSKGLNPDGPAPASGAPTGRVPKPMPLPPAAPPRRDLPIDLTLRQKALDALLALSTDADPILRANAIEAAQRTLPPDGSRPVILRGYSDTAGVVRFAACVATGQLKITDARPVLYKLAYDPDPSVRLAARFALHKIGDATLTQEMLLGLTDDRPGVRGNAVMLLGMLGEKSAVTPLKRLSRDPAPAVRLQLSEALWRLGDPEALDDLVARTISRFPDEQILALIALTHPRNPRVMEHVRGLMVADFPEVELAAARAAGILGSDEGLGLALKYRNHPEPRVRALAALAMGDIARSDTQDELALLLSDQIPQVRLAAATALLQLKEPRK